MNDQPNVKVQRYDFIAIDESGLGHWRVERFEAEDGRHVEFKAFAALRAQYEAERRERVFWGAEHQREFDRWGAAVNEFAQVEAGEEVFPQMQGYRMQCCDCGLVHTLNFRVVKVVSVSEDGVHSTVEPEGADSLRIVMTAFREDAGND